MPLWRYIHFNYSTRKIASGETYKLPETIVDPNDVDYVEVDIVGLYEVHYSYFGDYLAWRDEIEAAITTKEWANLSSAEKQIAIDLNIRDRNLSYEAQDLLKVPFLMGTGLGQSEAVAYMQHAFANDHVKEVESCADRAAHDQPYFVVSKYLDTEDAADFFKMIQSLFDQYRSQAIKGINYGRGGLGLFDFIENTSGTIYETAGLEAQGFTMQNGDPDSSNLTLELMNWFKFRQTS